MSYNYVIGRQCTEQAIGKAWTFARFSRTVWADLAREARRLMPDPIAILGTPEFENIVKRDAEILRGLMVKDAEELQAAKKEGRKPILIAPQYVPISKGIEEKAYLAKTRYLSAGSPELAGFMNSNEGLAFVFFLLLRPNHPEITDETAYDVFWDLSLNAEQKYLGGGDGRMTPDEIISTCNGRSPAPAKNEASPV